METTPAQEQTKRSAFRFRGSGEPVAFRTAYEEGEGLLKNISTDGCALELATCSPDLGEKLLLILEPGEEGVVIEAQGLVVRVKENDFAVKFSLIEPDSKRLIRKYYSVQSKLR